MFVTTLSLSLFLASSKRRQELIKVGDASARKVLNKYSIALLNNYILLSSICTIVFYSLFVVTSKSKLSLSIPLVIFGLMRYWLIIDKPDSSDSPTEIVLKDFQIKLLTVLWFLVTVYSLYYR